MDIDDDGKFHLATYRAQAGAAGGGIIMYMTDRDLTADVGNMEVQTISKSIQFSIEDSEGNEVPSTETVSYTHLTLPTKA